MAAAKLFIRLRAVSRRPSVEAVEGCEPSSAPVNRGRLYSVRNWSTECSKTDVAGAIGGGAAVEVVVPEETAVTSGGAEVIGGTSVSGCGCKVEVTRGGVVVMMGAIGEVEEPVVAI